MFWNGIDLRWAYADLLPNIHRKTYCRHRAYDILHDALLRFALSKNPDRQDKPHAYLRTIVHHLLIDSYKDLARFVPLIDNNPDTSDGETSGYIQQLTDTCTAPSPEHLADIQQRLQLLQNIINLLPARCREAFWLFRIEGMEQKAIAQKLGISLNMVERHIMRAILDLRAARDLIRG